MAAHAARLAHAEPDAGTVVVDLAWFHGQRTALFFAGESYPRVANAELHTAPVGRDVKQSESDGGQAAPFAAT